MTECQLQIQGIQGIQTEFARRQQGVQGHSAKETRRVGGAGERSRPQLGSKGQKSGKEAEPLLLVAVVRTSFPVHEMLGFVAPFCETERQF